MHAADDCQSGHKAAFAEAATRLGFEGPMTRTPPGLDLTADVITLAEALGPFPHARLDPTAADAPVPVPPGAAPAPDPGGARSGLSVKSRFVCAQVHQFVQRASGDGYLVAERLVV
jgi:biotin carboxylase